ncbi:tetratricopeptide repeat protein [Zhouia amylolytica]|uniref:Tetratricopeptide repeat protein n=1 Tax=Zhouia amylolytica AD3 TaxID=1286632 RepID=W2UL99_9FLAO|nr:tetratricopeptide repeat protein [Zhouia amylolytica]ETN94112.1 hypothetical protein P278_29160 [Zhouia amylolytica AD3]
MKQCLKILLIFTGLIIYPQASIAQEEVNADTTNEIVQDAFQEHFYEALKQRGIENYDRAVQHLLKCKEISPEIRVVDFELAKNYTDLKEYQKAVSYLQPIVKKDPGNVWYLEALLNVYERQHDTDRAIELAEKLSDKRPYFKQNLVLLYARVGRYEEALKLIEELELLYGESYLLDSLRGHLNAVLKSQELAEVEPDDEMVSAPDDIDQALSEMRGLIKVNAYPELLSMSTQTLENYPSHPEVYYCKGVALNGLKKYKDAAEFLEIGLNYIIDDRKLQDNIYRQLVLAYKGMGNTKKESEYQNKLKG